MVPEFDAFCFAEHEVGDTGIVYGTNGSYAGYHVMYFAGEGELYSDTLAENDLRSTQLQAWLDELSGGYEAVPGSAYKRIGK